MRRHAAGFTLVELMVSVAIIGLLASLAVPELSGMVAKARQSDFQTLFATYHTMILNYYRQNGYLPKGNWSFVSEPPLGPAAGNISGWSNSASPYFPGKDVLTEKVQNSTLYADNYKPEPWASLVQFGAPTVVSSSHRFALYASSAGDYLIMYGFHNFNHDKVVGYDYEIFEVDPWIPEGIYTVSGSYRPNE